MTRLRVAVSRIAGFLFRRRRDGRLAREIQHHLELLIDEYAARGMSPADARAAARRAFGGVDQLTEAYRDQRGLPFIDAFLQDVRFGVRLLQRDPAFAAAAVLVLATGIGTNNMLFTILNAHTMRGLPVHDADRVVYMTSADDRAQDAGVEYRDFLEWRAASGSFAAMAAFADAPVVVSEIDRPADRLDGAFVSADAFRLIGVGPVLGRDFRPEDDRPGAAPVVLLGYGAWQSRYGGDPGVLGRSVHANGGPATIVGVVPDRSGFPSTAQVWLPLASMPGIGEEPRGARPLRVLGRVRDDRTVSEARAEVEAVAARLARQRADATRPVRARIVPLNDQYLGSVTDPAWMAFAAAGGLVLLISCANAANLMLARSVHRARELTIRTSLGASRRRLIRQLVIEGGVLAALGGLAGLALAVTGIKLFGAAIPADVLPYWFDYSTDARVLAALVIVSAGTVFIFAFLPALQASRPDVSAVLKQASRAVTVRTSRWTTAFVAAEFGLAVVLLAQLVVSIRTSAPPVASDGALDSGDVLTATVTLPGRLYQTGAQRVTFYDRLGERLGSLPAVSSMAFASVLPLSGGEEKRLEIEGRSMGGRESTVRTVAVSPGYFRTLGMALLRGRDLTGTDGGPGERSVIVNERFVEQFLEGSDPIGKRLALSARQGEAGERTWRTVVGVAPSIRQRPGPTPEPLVYEPFRPAQPSSAQLLVRSGTDTAALASLLRDEVAGLDRDLPLYRVRTLARASRDAQWNGRLSKGLFLTLTFIAVTLATIGLHAVTAYAAGLRAHEIGVRMALGARPWQVMTLVGRRVAART